ncbi:MAG: hypothetical protein OXL95_10680 [Nitrospira sp.]|nr:hypothetical protein [Nitrospira sp.]
MDRHRRYDGEGKSVKGDYAKIFEEEYKRFAKHPDYRGFFDPVGFDVAAVHNGYFSIDKKGGWIDTAENTQANLSAIFAPSGSAVRLSGVACVYALTRQVNACVVSTSTRSRLLRRRATKSSLKICSKRSRPIRVSVLAS